MEIKLNEHTFEVENCIEEVLINPTLPDNFNNTDNSIRPDSHDKWWYRPYIVTGSVEDLDKFHANRTDEYAEQSRQNWIENRKKWLISYPTGIQYCVRCLDGGAWDRSTNYGCYADLDVALVKANELKENYRIK